MPEWLAVAGSVASVLGFVAAIWAALSAKAARAARNEAEAIVDRMRVAGMVEAIERCRRQAELIGAALAEPAGAGVRYLVAQLHSDVVLLCARYGQAAPEQARRPMMAAREYAREVAAPLVGSPTDTDWHAIRGHVETCHRALATALGYAIAGLDVPMIEEP